MKEGVLNFRDTLFFYLLIRWINALTNLRINTFVNQCIPLFRWNRRRSCDATASRLRWRRWSGCRCRLRFPLLKVCAGGRRHNSRKVRSAIAGDSRLLCLRGRRLGIRRCGDFFWCVLSCCYGSIQWPVVMSPLMTGKLKTFFYPYQWILHNLNGSNFCYTIFPVLHKMYQLNVSRQRSFRTFLVASRNRTHASGISLKCQGKDWGYPMRKSIL